MLATREVSELKIAIPKGGLLEALDPQVSSAFARACTLLSQAGARLTDIDTAPLAELQALNPNATIQAVEAMAWHRDLIARRGDDYDPNVKSRIEAGAGIAAIDYVDCLMRRNPLSQRLDRLTAEFDGLIMPTVPMIAPSIAACEREAGNIRARLIRNTSPLNYLDRPAISIPIHEPESAPIGLMIIGAHDRDWELLSIARSIEACLGSKFA
jgi:aspartyl-tRNA(Asn)/glutamyl-tRNA(Gln) amidotransferase subunit A